MELYEVVVIAIFFGILQIPYVLMEHDDVKSYKDGNVFQRYAMRHRVVYLYCLLMWAASVVITGLSLFSFLFSLC